MASRPRKKPRRKTSIKGVAATARTAKRDPQLVKLAQSLSQLGKALERRSQPDNVHDALNDCRDLVAQLLGLSSTAPESAHGDVEEALDDYHNDPTIFDRAPIEPSAEHKTLGIDLNEGFHHDRRHKNLDVGNAMMEDLERQQGDDRRKKPPRVKRFERQHLDQVPAGYATADEAEGLYLLPITKFWKLDQEHHVTASRLVARIAAFISPELGFQLMLLASTRIPETQTGDGEQITSWLSDCYLRLQVIEGQAVREDRKIRALSKVQVALVKQVEGLALMREQARLAKEHGRQAGSIQRLLNDELGEQFRASELLSGYLAESEQQPTPAEVVVHLRKHWGDEVPPELTADVVERMSNAAFLNPGAKGKYSAEKLVLTWYSQCVHK